ncbi:MAG: hypothetical protein ACWGSQ_20045, partial [Longimicrobiales bacterium]
EAIRQSTLVVAGEAGGLAPEGLFASDTPLVLTLEADFSQLKKDREQESEDRPGRITLSGGGAGEISVPVQVRTRGSFRLRAHICPFPPLRVEFPVDSVAGTVLEGQAKLKLVTHCRDWDSYEQNLLEEYLAYRIYNLLTDVSFRVHLALITYVDTGGGSEPVSRAAFFIESEDALAARLEGTMLEVPAASPEDYPPQQIGLVNLFQFLIGNTDWSPVLFHNVKLIQVGWDYLPIPYDFDFSGLVDTPYAGPNPRIADRITTVTERLYWGACSDRIDFPALFYLFNERRDEIMDLVRTQPGLEERNIRLAMDYIQGFYEIINDEHEADWRILSACRHIGESGF